MDRCPSQSTLSLPAIIKKAIEKDFENFTNVKPPFGITILVKLYLPPL